MSFLQGLFGPPNVEKLEAKGNVEGLIEALSYSGRSGSGVRAAAAVSLGRIGDRRAVEPLVAALKDGDAIVRDSAAEALGSIGAPAIEPLLCALKDWRSSVRVRSSAAEAFVSMGAPGVEPLIIALKDGSRGVQQLAVKALSKLSWQPTDDAVGATYWILGREWERCVEIGAPAVEPLIAELGDRDAEVQRRAAEALGSIGDERAVEPLVSLLRNVLLRRSATEALVKIGAPAVEPLIDALGDRDAPVQRHAAEALGRIGDERAVEPLVSLLRNVLLRGTATQALVKIGEPAGASLIHALKYKGRQVQELAIEALGNLSWQPADDAVGAAYWILRREWERCVEIGAPAVEPLIAALGNRRDAQVRQRAAEALGRIGDERAVEPLIAALEDEWARDSAAEALYRLGWKPSRDTTGARYWIAKGQWAQCAEIGAPAVKPLIAALGSGRPLVRRGASSALVTIGAPAVEPLIAELRDGDAKVRKRAAEALVMIGAPAVEPLVAVLKDGDPRVRENAANALRSIGAPAMKPLVAALKNPAWASLRQEMAEILEAIGWQPSRDAAGAIYWITKRQCEQCVEIGAPAVELLIAALEDVDSEVRKSAIDALGSIGDPRGVSSLLSALKDGDVDIRMSVVGALGRIGGASVVKPLTIALQDKTLAVRRHAAEALLSIEDVRVVEPLIAILKEPIRGLEKSAAEALGRIGDARAVEPLLAVLEHKDLGVRRAAAESLVAIYQSGSLDEQAIQQILAVRGIFQEHYDSSSHLDLRNCYWHDDRTTHTDRGSGVEFPL